MDTLFTGQIRCSRGRLTRKVSKNLWKKTRVSSYWKGKLVEYLCLGIPDYRRIFWGLKTEGFSRKDNWADITILDLNKLKVYNDFENPNLKPEGIQYVIVNGSIAYKNGCLSNLRNGMMLRKNNQ